jgi:LPS-assembly protein
LGADFPDGPGGLSYQFDSEVVNFTHRDNFNTGQPVVGGGRFNAGTGVSLPINWLGSYVVPKVQLQATGYSVHDQSDASAPNNISRFLPMISVDSGAVFSRPIKFFRHSYNQTLEPRLFYLFVPETNQEDIPIFDTNLPALDFEQLFDLLMNLLLQN